MSKTNTFFSKAKQTLEKGVPEKKTLEKGEN